ncbi:MAG: MarR family winged helix-turn-helix transcriptional regulator [Aeromicrobium sp.]
MGVQQPAVPSDLPYGSKPLIALSALFYVWSLPRFQTALAGRLDPGVDLGVHTLVRELILFGPQRPSTVAERLGKSRSNMSKVANRAIDAQLVLRRGEDGDARSVVLDLTAAGQALGADALKIGDTMMDELVEGWSAEELEMWTNLTHRLSVAAADYATRLMADTSVEDGPPGGAEQPR